MTANVRHDNNRNDVTLAWKCNDAYTAQGFSVERSTDGVNFTQIASLPTSVMTFTDPTVGPGVFYYRVRSFNAQGFSRSSNVVAAEVNVPAAPVNLHVQNLFAQHVVIAWDPNSSDQTGFQIERSSDGVNFAPVGTVDAYTTSFTDVRFPAPVPVGSRVRMRATLSNVEDVPGGVQITVTQMFETEGGSKPVCVAESLARLYTG